MSHSQFHCTGRAYLDMHGLIFETSICYWQDQPGRRARACGEADPATKRDDERDKRRERQRRGGGGRTVRTGGEKKVKKATRVERNASGLPTPSIFSSLPLSSPPSFSYPWAPGEPERSHTPECGAMGGNPGWGGREQPS